MDLIAKFSLLTQTMTEKLQEIQWREDTEVVEVKYLGDTIDVYDILKNPQFHNELMVETIFLVEIEVVDDLWMIDDFIQNYELNLLQDESIISVTIIFQKKLRMKITNNALLFFKLDSFLNIFKVGGSDWEKFYNHIDSTHYVKWFLPVQSIYKNNYMSIVPIERFTTEEEKLDNISRSEMTRIKTTHQENTRTGVIQWPVPSSFRDIKTDQEHLNSLLNISFFISVLVYLSNIYKKDMFSFRGQRNVTINADPSFQPTNLSQAEKLFNFAYSSSHTEDRFEILQNVISNYINSGETISQFYRQIENIVETVQRHYTLYVNDEVNHFFGQTKALLEESQKNATQAKEEADKIVSYINQTIVGIITVLISGLLAAINQSKGLFLASLVIHIIYFVYSYWVNSRYSKSKQAQIKEAYQFYTQKYSNLSDNEKEELNSQYMKPVMSLIERYLIRYLKITIIISTILTLISVSGILWPSKFELLFGTDEKNEVINLVSLREGSGGDAVWWRTLNNGISDSDDTLIENVVNLINKDIRKMSNFINPSHILLDTKTKIKSVKLSSTIKGRDGITNYILSLNYSNKDKSFRCLMTMRVQQNGQLVSINISNVIEL